MRQPLVSIIVPVYNAQDFLRRCVESILNQKYRNIELILVNDGSRDNSLMICEEYRRQDERVLVIDKSNTGVSNSRNIAIHCANGKYLQFVDSDDWITENATQVMVECAEANHCDMVIADFYRVVNKRMAVKGHIDTDRPLSRNEYIGYMMEEPANFYYGVMWNKLYRKDIVLGYDIQCSEELNWCEDFQFNLEYILYANKFCAVKVPVYYYVKNKNSLVSKEVTITNTIRVKRTIFEYYKEVFERAQMYEDNKYQVTKFMIAVCKDGSVNFINSMKTPEAVNLPIELAKNEAKRKSEEYMKEQKAEGGKKSRKKEKSGEKSLLAKLEELAEEVLSDEYKEKPKKKTEKPAKKTVKDKAAKKLVKDKNVKEKTGKDSKKENKGKK